MRDECESIKAENAKLKDELARLQEDRNEMFLNGVILEGEKMELQGRVMELEKELAEMKAR